jgi:phosphate ABC transporter permease protein PstC
MPEDTTFGAGGKTAVAAAADFDRPLLLTPRQDLLGWLGRRVGLALLQFVAFTCVLSVLFIFVFIAKEALPFFTSGHVGEMFTSAEWRPTDQVRPVFGIWAMVIGSLDVTVGALVIAVPIGLLAAVFLSDIVPFGMRQVVKPVIELLAAIPSVAYGFFAALVFAPWMQDHLGIDSGKNALNCSIILAVMAIPTIVSISEDALSAVGRDLREGAYALGATRAEALCTVIIPAAGRGIIAGIILGMMRAIGETMLVWMASGNATQIIHPWYDFTQSVRTMTATIAGEMGETAQNTPHYHALFVVGLVLLAITFGLNLISEALMARGRGQVPAVGRRKA